MRAESIELCNQTGFDSRGEGICSYARTGGMMHYKRRFAGVANTRNGAVLFIRYFVYVFNNILTSNTDEFVQR